MLDSAALPRTLRAPLTRELGKRLGGYAHMMDAKGTTRPFITIHRNYFPQRADEPCLTFEESRCWGLPQDEEGEWDR